MANHSEPIFGALLDTEQKQRIAGLADDHVVKQQLDIVIDDTRGEFWTRLGRARLDAIVAFAAADPPTTDDGYMRLLAATTEQKMIREGLLGWIPFAAKEGSGGRIHQQWNDVSAFRGMTAARARDERSRLSKEINRAFAYLSGEVLPGNSASVRATTIGSELGIQHRKVGFSLYVEIPYFFHFALDTDTTNAG